MRVALEKLDVDGLVVDMPMGEPPSERRVATVRTAKGLGGLLEAREAGVAISGLVAATIDLDALHLDFGAVRIDAAGDEGAREGRVANELRRVEGRYEKRGGHLSLDLRAAEVFATRLAVDVVNVGVQVSGEVHIRGMRLVVDGAEGRVEGRAVEITDFRFRWGEIEVTAPRLEATAMVIGWGERFVLEAESLSAPELGVAFGSGRATLSATGARLEGARLHDGDLDLRAAAFDSLRAEAALQSREDDAESEPTEAEDAAAETPTRFDLRILDGVGGELNVDLVVDLSVPVIGSRRATHRFRIPIDAGSVDYLGLENDLSALESALLDFAVRDDGTLVLELGIPLLPTRGRGKPILVWDLTPEDRALAARKRIRLALLPKARFAGEAVSEDTAKKGSREKDESAFALRQIGIRSVEANFEVAPVAGEVGGLIEALSIAKLAIRGNMHYEPNDPRREGELRVALEALAFALRPLAIGAQTLTAGRVGVARATDLRVRFVDIQPRSVDGALEGVMLERLSLRST
jgi:hypothetical protein